MSNNDDTPSLAHALHKVFILSGSKPFLGYPKHLIDESGKEDIIYTWLTYDEVFQKVLHLADSLRQIPLPQRSVVGICADNCVEWIVTDFSCTFNDYITVGLHSSWSDECLINVLTSAQTSCIVCMSCDLLKFLRVSTVCTSIQSILVIGGDTDTDTFSSVDNEIIKQFAKENIRNTVTVYLFNSFLRKKRTQPISTDNKNDENYSMGQPFQPFIENNDLKALTGAGGKIPCWFGLHSPIPSGESDEIHTLMYTSGTTGSPKGVAVTKNRWLIDAKSNSFPGQSDPTVVVICPWHMVVTEVSVGKRVLQVLKSV